MDLGVISVRYARALLKSAIAEKQEYELYQSMQSLAESYVNVPELRFTIDNPMLSKEAKQTVLETACENNVNQLTKRFIALVLKEGREKALQFMAASYITLYRKHNNITSSRLVTASTVDTATEQKVIRLVEGNTQGTVEFHAEVDPEIIGGFILEYDTYRMDASVKSKLRRILTELKK